MNFPWRIFSRLVLIQAGLILFALAASALGTRYYFKRSFLAQVEHQLKDTLVALSHDLPPRPSQQWCTSKSHDTSIRYTVVRPDGTVACDSHREPTVMEDHATRPEIVAAREKGFGSAVRYSTTVEESMLYGAITVEGQVLRGAIPLTDLRTALRLFDRSVVVFFLAVALLLGLFSVWSGRRLAFPIGRLLVKAKGGADTEDLDEDTYGELTELETSIDDIRRDLQAKSESLTAEREELATLMSAISDAVLAVGRDETPLFFNSRFALLFNHQELGKRNLRLWEMFRDPEVLSAFHLALGEGRSAETQILPIEREGVRRFFSVSVSPLRRKGGEVYGAVGIFHDVTELKRAEQIRIDFVANVSHELRTPLASIKGYTDTLIQDAATGKAPAREFLDVIRRNTDRLMSLINDLLDLSSLESHVDTLQKVGLDTTEISSRVVGQLQAAFDAKGQKVEVAARAPHVLADPRRLEQVLVNLLDNANKYTPPQGKVGVVWENAPDGGTKLKISDSGPGIPPEHHPRLFERFYRVDKARSRELGGTGLGLAIVKHIMQRHGGSIWVESAPGRGTTFLCRFPGN